MTTENMRPAFMAEVVDAAIQAMQANGLANRTERLEQVRDQLRLTPLASQPQAAGAGGDAEAAATRLWQIMGDPIIEFDAEERAALQAGIDALRAQASDAGRGEAVPADVRAMMDHDDRAARLIALAEAAGAKRDEDDNGQWWTVRYEHWRAMTASPASEDSAGKDGERNDG